MVLYIKLINLEKNKELNGTLAEVLDYDEEYERFVVKLYNMTKAKVKVENILDIEENLSTINTPREFHIGKSPTKSQKSNKYRRNKKMKKQEKNSEVEECSICMDVMRGEVKLKCGHKMCPECFAQHSRKNNTCPYCRDVFSPKVEGKSRITEQLADEMISEVVEDYFDADEENEIDTKLNELLDLNTNEKVRINMAKIDIKSTIYAHMRETARLMYEDIEEWYDENE